MVGRELQKIRPNGEDHPGLIGGKMKGRAVQNIDKRKTMIDLKR